MGTRQRSGEPPPLVPIEVGESVLEVRLGLGGYERIAPDRCRCLVQECHFGAQEPAGGAEA